STFVRRSRGTTHAGLQIIATRISYLDVRIGADTPGELSRPQEWLSHSSIAGRIPSRLRSLRRYRRKLSPHEADTRPWAVSTSQSSSGGGRRPNRGVSPPSMKLHWLSRPHSKG